MLHNCCTLISTADFCLLGKASSWLFYSSSVEIYKCTNASEVDVKLTGVEKLWPTLVPLHIATEILHSGLQATYISPKYVPLLKICTTSENVYPHAKVYPCRTHEWLVGQVTYMLPMNDPWKRWLKSPWITHERFTQKKITFCRARSNTCCSTEVARFTSPSLYNFQSLWCRSYIGTYKSEWLNCSDWRGYPNGIVQLQFQLNCMKQLT